MTFSESSTARKGTVRHANPFYSSIFAQRLRDVHSSSYLHAKKGQQLKTSLKPHDALSRLHPDCAKMGFPAIAILCQLKETDLGTERVIRQPRSIWDCPMKKFAAPSGNIAPDCRTVDNACTQEGKAGITFHLDDTSYGGASFTSLKTGCCVHHSRRLLSIYRSLVSLLLSFLTLFFLTFFIVFCSIFIQIYPNM